MNLNQRHPRTRGAGTQHTPVVLLRINIEIEPTSTLRYDRMGMG